MKLPTIYGNHHWRKIEFKIPPNARNRYIKAACFKYKGELHFLQEFFELKKKGATPFCGNYPGIYKWMETFHLFKMDSFFSGLLVRFSKDKSEVQVYTYY